MRGCGGETSEKAWAPKRGQGGSIGEARCGRRKSHGQWRRVAVFIEGAALEVEGEGLIGGGQLIFVSAKKKLVFYGRVLEAYKRKKTSFYTITWVKQCNSKISTEQLMRSLCKSWIRF